MLALRRPLLFALIFACAVSLFTSGRLTLRLAGPAAVYWSFVPLIEVAALGVVCRGKLRTISLAKAIDLFFTGFGPWLLWLTGLAAIWAWLPPMEAFQWTKPFWLLIAAPAVLVGYSDLCFFRSVLDHGPGRALMWQGGIAIAAHPMAEFWPAFDEEAMRKLDGAEVVQPVIYAAGNVRREFQEFFARKRLTAIGSSDYHGLGPVGLCRTYVFVRDAGEAGILQALREGHTVVYDRLGAVYGDPALIQLAGPESRLRRPEPTDPPSRFLVAMSRTCGLLGMIGLEPWRFPVAAHGVTAWEPRVRPGR